MYPNGTGFPQDHGEARRWYRLAADQGLASAQHALAYMYLNGEGVLQDYVRAHMWSNLAALRGIGEIRNRAVSPRDSAARRMTPHDLSEAQRLAREWEAAHPRDP